MQYGRVPGIDKPVARLVMGTMIINDNEPAKGLALLDAIYELGGNTFDTARIYSSEPPLGRWINERGIRDEVVIIDKGAHPEGDRKRVTPADISADLAESLGRLGTDYIDLYLLHRDDPDVPVGPIIEALNEHVDAGRIRAFGASNWQHQRIGQANEYAASHGLVPFARDAIERHPA